MSFGVFDEEVKCSIENGFVLHDWQKVLESPVFKNGFKPMKGHDGNAEAGKKGEQEEGAVDDEAREEEKGMVSEHGKVQMEGEKEVVVMGGNVKVAAH